VTINFRMYFIAYYYQSALATVFLSKPLHHCKNIQIWCHISETVMDVLWKTH